MTPPPRQSGRRGTGGASSGAVSANRPTPHGALMTRALRDAHTFSPVFVPLLAAACGLPHYMLPLLQRLFPHFQAVVGFYTALGPTAAVAATAAAWQAGPRNAAYPVYFAPLAQVAALESPALEVGTAHSLAWGRITEWARSEVYWQEYEPYWGCVTPCV